MAKGQFNGLLQYLWLLRLKQQHFIGRQAQLVALPVAKLYDRNVDSSLLKSVGAHLQVLRNNCRIVFAIYGNISSLPALLLLTSIQLQHKIIGFLFGQGW